MAIVCCSLRASLAILLVLLPIAMRAHPIISPLLESICNDVQCGKGHCEVDLGKPFNFVCKCESGWKRTRHTDDEDFEFLPCIIPNCSLDYSCMPAAPPAPPVPYNFSFFDPCYWMYCGEGTCTKNLTYTHTCQCNPGRNNLLDISAFPCYNDCAIGSDCERLGIRVSGSTTSTSNSSDAGSTTSTSNSSDVGSPGTSLLPRKMQWVGIWLLSAVALLWK